jgi:membrane-bound lytic murein transglycosylase MltF
LRKLPILARVAASIALVLCATHGALAQTATGKYDDAFRKYSKRFFGPGFDWRLFKAQAMAESHLDPSAASCVGARGLMQLMPATFGEIQSKNPEFQTIDDPVWNIAAGICYDRRLWMQWNDAPLDQERVRFVMGSYNAGRGTLLKARSLADQRRLDPGVWQSIRVVAPDVPRWRHDETLGYVDRIESNLQWLCAPRLLAGSRAGGSAPENAKPAATPGAPPPSDAPPSPTHKP